MAEKSLELLASSIKQLASEVQDARHRGSEDSEAFEKLIDALDDMRADLVGPMQWLGTLFAPPDYAALQTAFLHHVFEHVPTDGKDTASASIHVKDLSELVEIPADILLRIMRLLATNKIFLEIDECVFCHTTLSAGMVDEMVSARLGSFSMIFSRHLRVFQMLLMREREVLGKLDLECLCTNILRRFPSLTESLWLSQ